MNYELRRLMTIALPLRTKFIKHVVNSACIERPPV